MRAKHATRRSRRSPAPEGKTASFVEVTVTSIGQLNSVSSAEKRHKIHHQRACACRSAECLPLRSTVFPLSRSFLLPTRPCSPSNDGPPRWASTMRACFEATRPGPISFDCGPHDRRRAASLVRRYDRYRIVHDAPAEKLRGSAPRAPRVARDRDPCSNPVRSRQTSVFAALRRLPLRPYYFFPHAITLFQAHPAGRGGDRIRSP